MNDIEKVRIITCAWGASYVEDMMELQLPAVLAPDNVPALAKEFNCELVLLTKRKHTQFVEQHPTCAELRRYCSVDIRSIDDLVACKRQYGISLTLIYHRGFADLGHKMIDTFLLFLNSDWILANGSYKNLIPLIKRGERMIYAPGYCTEAEAVTGWLNDNKARNENCIDIGNREMAGQILANLHPCIEAKTINRQSFSMHVFDQFYWRVDENTMLGRQMPIGVIGMRPEQVVHKAETFWDFGFPQTFCPTNKGIVLDDSDNFLMLELRPRDTYSHFMELGWPSEAKIAADLSTYQPTYHRESGKHELILHSTDLPATLGDARRKMASFVDSVYAQFKPEQQNDGIHPFWVAGYSEVMEAANNWRSRSMARSDDLPQSKEKYAQGLADTSIQHQFSLRSIGSKVLGFFIGRYPSVTRLHPYRPMVDLFRSVLDEIKVPTKPRVLFISSTEVSLAAIMPAQFQGAVRIFIDDLLDISAPGVLPSGETEPFHLIIIELDQNHFDDISTAIQRLNEAEVKFVHVAICISDFNFIKLDKKGAINLLSRLPSTYDIQTFFCANPFSAMVIQAIKRATSRSTDNSFRRRFIDAAYISLLPFYVILQFFWRERYGRRAKREYISGMIIKMTSRNNREDYL